jgi:hypothetical protein
MIYYPSLANVVTQADCSQGLNVRSAEGKAIACQSTEGQRRLERSGRHLRGRIDQSGGRGGRLNVDSGFNTLQAPPQDPLLTRAGSESRSAAGREMFDASRLGNHSAQIELIAIKAKHEVPNGRRQNCILPIGVDAGDQVAQGLPALFSDLSCRPFQYTSSRLTVVL